MSFHPKFTISIPIASALIAIERTRGFLEAAQLSKDWVAKMQARALILEAHHTTHIEGTHLSLDQSSRLIAGEKIAGVDQTGTIALGKIFSLSMAAYLWLFVHVHKVHNAYEVHFIVFNPMKIHIS